MVHPQKYWLKPVILARKPGILDKPKAYCRAKRDIYIYNISYNIRFIHTGVSWNGGTSKTPQNACLLGTTILGNHHIPTHSLNSPNSTESHRFVPSFGALDAMERKVAKGKAERGAKMPAKMPRASKHEMPPAANVVPWWDNRQKTGGRETDMKIQGVVGTCFGWKIGMDWLDC